MIVLKNVKMEYEEGKPALKNINLKIDKGEFVYLMGHSGAGKSTLTRLLLKEIEPTAGKIFLDGQDITYVSERKIPYIRRYIGTVFQDFRILEKKTVYENVAFALEILGTKSKEIRRRVPIILSLVGLSEKAKNFPTELSGGEKQRVAIARAIINEPAVLIADEPTGNLDIETSLEIMQLLTDINHRGTTILMATHAKDIVERIPHRIIMLEHGKLVRDTGSELEEMDYDVDYGKREIDEIDDVEKTDDVDDKDADVLADYIDEDDYEEDDYDEEYEDEEEDDL